jgi:hypothetical protein
MYASIQDMKNRIIEVLEPELQATDPNYNADLLEAKADQTLEEAQVIRNYAQVGYSEQTILADMSTGLPVFINVTRYDYNKIGAEGQSQYSGDGESLHYLDRGKMWNGWMPLARIQ